MNTMTKTLPTLERPPSYRWMQLFMGIICMVMIANLQYGWTLFVGPISDKYGELSTTGSIRVFMKLAAAEAAGNV